MKFQIACFSLLIACVFFQNRSFSQISSASRENRLPYVVTYYNAKQGLPQNQVLDVVEGKDGIIVSTINGVVSYNGIEFLPFIRNKKPMADVYYELFYDKKEEKLFGWTQNGSYNQIFPDYKNLSVYVCVSSDGKSVTGIRNDGLIRTFSYDTETVYNTVKTDITNGVAVVSHDKHYFVSDNNYLYKINKKTGGKQVVLEGSFSVLAKNPYTSELIAVSEQGDLFRIGETQLHHIRILDHRYSTGLFRKIDFLNGNEFFVTSMMGLYHVKDGVSYFYDMNNGLISNSLYSVLYYKNENCIFIGTENRGLMVLTPKKVKTYYTDSKISGSQSFASVIRGSDGTIYSTASKGEIIQIKNGVKKTYLSTNSYLASLSYIHDKIYAGSWGEGIFIYKNGIKTDSINYPRIPSIHVRSILKDSMNTIWIGTSNGIVKQLPDGTLQTVSSDHPAIISIYEMKSGNLCFGGNEGMLMYNREGKLIRRIGIEQGLKCKEVRSFYEDKKGRLWIGTYGGGLYVYDHGRLTSINNKPNCALNQDIFTLVKNKDGQLYMSSNQGIWSVSESKLNDFYEGRIAYLIPAYHGEEAGIVNIEFNGGFQNNYLQLENKIYFPSIYGLVELNTEQQLPYRKLIPEFKSIILNDSITPSVPVFERNTHTIQFDFYCPSYVEEYNVHYQYRIKGEGLPDNWTRPQKENSVSLKMLPPGDYTFSVRGIDCFNDAEPVELSYHFTIKPFFYEMTWFRLFFGLLIIANIVLLVRLRIRKESEKNKIKNTIMELKLKAIQSRMNPHFMFNSLNNIIYLLSIEKYDEAEQLLQDFSLLLRRFLENSDNSFLTIEEELEITKLYLAIQQKRYNHSFDYSVQCPPELFETSIPSMLIQPFVENAIIHGIIHSDVPCILAISIEKENDRFIKIRIEDNGIGRAKSTVINKSRKRHTSHGIALVKEKINVMRQHHGIIIDLTIEDAANYETGTLVTIKISINDNQLLNR